ncbi:MAG: NAD-dependent epimerase/dehydratase family protein [Chloroflexota bacterium]|nr:NAD-dependent epimerase/dehydratase family protein [Chloroflexota bacterium]
MRVLLIGGTGFIGPWVVRRLVGAGHDVTVFHRGEHEADLPAAVAHVHGDRDRLADHTAALRRFAPDVVLDTRPLRESDARAVVEAFAGTARRLVAISSMDVYRAYGRLHGTEPGPSEPTPFAEDAPLRERFYPYRSDPPRAEDDPMRWADDYDKIPVERVVLGEPRLPGTVLRLPFVYGPGDRQHRLWSRLKRMMDGRSAILLGETEARWRGTRGYVENVAAAIALAATEERAAGRVYNVGEREAPTEADFLRAVGRAAGWRGEVVTVPDDRLPPHLAPQANLAQDMVADTERIRRELGYAEPVPRPEWLRRTVEWERAHPPETFDPAEFDYAAEDAVLAGSGTPGTA